MENKKQQLPQESQLDKLTKQLVKNLKTSESIRDRMLDNLNKTKNQSSPADEILS